MDGSKSARARTRLRVQGRFKKGTRQRAPRNTQQINRLLDSRLWPKMNDQRARAAPSSNTVTTGRSLSHFERLPVELLEDIYLRSRNIDVPLVSRRLWSSLWNERNRFAFVCMMFLPDDEDHHLFVLRTTILSGAWFTKRVWEEARTKVLSSADYAIPSCPRCRGRHWEKPLDMLLPPRLVRGPWTYDQGEFVRDLMAWGAYVDWERTTTGEDAIVGLRTAILTDLKRSLWMLTTARRGCTAGGTGPPAVGVPPDTMMFRSVVVDRDCDEGMFEALFDALHSHHPASVIDDVDFLDPIMWNALERAKGKHKPGADAIKRIITAKVEQKKLGRFSTFRSGHRFRPGSSSRPDVLCARYPPNV
ncbi:MAG: hypothetical protein M1833_006261 [Piccolia ochrophora]|nr:MAG: hypothetical protein M1833_006261 [Piccolia ochrophora]